MIPTYTYAIKAGIISNYLGANLAVALINNPNLGITDTPTTAELEARKNFSTTSLFNFEIGEVNLNGYARALVTSSNISPSVVTPDQTEANITVTFTADGGSFDPFSHLVVLRGANTVGADATLNGNNRGDTNGTIIFIEPVENTINPGTPLVLDRGISYNYSFKLVSSAQVL